MSVRSPSLAQRITDETARSTSAATTASALREAVRARTRLIRPGARRGAGPPGRRTR
ncbi:hypothetical protein G5V59_18195 [Nocardioides sp. W3-2-3]|nr:hypothetical protein [Nocardioides convexus]